MYSTNESLKLKFEDVYADWKPKKMSFNQVKKLFNKVKSNGYKFVNNEREEFMHAVDLCDKKQAYTPEQRKQIRDWHIEIWRANRNVQESKQLSELEHIDELLELYTRKCESIDTSNSIASAYVSNLGKYNEGSLTGAWISLPVDENELDNILRDKVGVAPNTEYEEYGIFDWESDYIDYPGEYANIYELNDLAELISEFDDYDRRILKAAQEAGFVNDISTFDSNDYILLDVYDDKELGEYVVSEYDYEPSEDELDLDKLGCEVRLYADEEDEDMYENMSDKEIGEYYLDMVGYEGIANVEYYIDYEEVGRRYRTDTTSDFTSLGFIEEMI